MLDTTQFMLWIKDPNLTELNYHATVLKVDPPELTTPQTTPKKMKDSSARAVLQSSEPFISPQGRIGSDRSLKKRSLEDEEEAPSESPSVGEQLTASLWSIVCISLVKEEKQDGIYQNLLTGTCPFESQIDSDIHRVLTTVRFETGDGPKLLHNILKGFSLYHPELGYSQELAFVAATLLLQLEEEGSFWVLSWLAQKYMFEGKSLFSQDVTLLKFCLYILEQLVAKKVPDLGRHLVTLNINASYFASEWFSTLFSYGYPLASSFRIWDVLFLEEKEYVFKIALSVMFLAKDELLKLHDIEDVVHFMKKELPSQMDIEQVLKVAEDISIPADVFLFYESSFQAANSTNPFVDP